MKQAHPLLLNTLGTKFFVALVVPFARGSYDAHGETCHNKRVASYNKLNADASHNLSTYFCSLNSPQEL